MSSDQKDIVEQLLISRCHINIVSKKCEGHTMGHFMTTEEMEDNIKMHEMIIEMHEEDFEKELKKYKANIDHHKARIQKIKSQIESGAKVWIRGSSPEDA
jgi:archaellum component FlaC